MLVRLSFSALSRIGRICACVAVFMAASVALALAVGGVTGVLRGTIVDGQRKAEILKEMAQLYACRLEQTVAIGDGANDIFMLQTAGLGIAFRKDRRDQEEDFAGVGVAAVLLHPPAHVVAIGLHR